MAKAKNKKAFNKHGSQPDPKKRKMQHFDRVSKSSTSTSNPAKKTKFNQANEPNTALAAAAASGKKRNTHQQEFHQRPTIPYQRKDRILLVGEGDFSFARSLAEHHRCKNVFASCYDSKDVLLGKYAEQVEANIKAFLQAGQSAEKRQEGASSSKENILQDDTGLPETSSHAMSKRVLFSVDARKLGTPTGGGKEIRQGIKQKKQTGGPWDIISFNFPHIGGKSTDVNRQVRANQELLVAFFKACVPLLSTSSSTEKTGDDEIDYSTDSGDSSRYHTDSEEDEDETEEKEQTRTVPRQSGQIIVTLFEGEPYTLWNVKDLARHAGLAVVTSFRFPWKSYPGYAHARTLGIVESRSGKAGGGWKGEDRDARTYVFEVKQENGHQQSKKKKKTEDTSDEDD